MIRMNNIIVDSNIFFNAWGRETDPKTGFEYWKASSEIIAVVKESVVRGYVSMINILEICHCVRIKAAAAGKDSQSAMLNALKKIEDFGFKRIAPESVALYEALSYIVDLSLDPFDAILLSIAVHEGMDAVISRDEKLRKKASDIIPILTPEEFLSA